MNDLLIPFAVDESGKLLIPAKARKDQELKCPECSNVVLLRRASRDESGVVTRQAHFAHLSSAHDSTCSGGTGESHAHNTAKRLVMQAITEWMDGDGPRPIFIFGCTCGQSICRYFPFQPTFAAMEHHLPSGLVPDVFVSDTTHRIAIEVLKSHRIEEEKITVYRSELSWWVEVSADPIIEEASWVVVRSSFKKDSFCPKCLDGKVTHLNRTISELDRKHYEMSENVSLLTAKHATLEAKIAVATSGNDRRLDELEQSIVNARKRLQEIEEGVVSARMKYDIEALDESLRNKRIEANSLSDYINHLREVVESIEVQVTQEPEGARWEFFWRSLQEARRFGYKPAYPSAKYKERYGVWPPSHWKDRAMQEFESDDDWRSRNASRSS